MTREDNDKAISNKERAEFATESGADITVRIHANSDNSASAAGALTMAPTSSNQYLDKELIEKSIRLHPVSSTITAMPPALQTKASSLPTI